MASTHAVSRPESAVLTSGRSVSSSTYVSASASKLDRTRGAPPSGASPPATNGRSDAYTGTAGVQRAAVARASAYADAARAHSATFGDRMASYTSSRTYAHARARSTRRSSGAAHSRDAVIERARPSIAAKMSGQLACGAPCRPLCVHKNRPVFCMKCAPSLLCTFPWAFVHKKVQSFA